MTKEEYADYQQRFSNGIKGLEHFSTGPCKGCEECGTEAQCCRICDGEGVVDIDGSDCPKCKGEGAVEFQGEMPEGAGEIEFTWSSCECCNRSLGGKRYPSHGIVTLQNGTELRVHLALCADCYYYANYGQLDDQTMLDLED